MAIREMFFYLDLIERASGGPKPPKGTLVVEGFASTTKLGSDNLIILKSALAAAADDLLTRSTVLLNHDPSQPIGKVVRSELRSLGEDSPDHGIWVQIFLSKSRKDIFDFIQDGTLNKFSIRGNIKDSVEEFDPTLGGQVVKVTDLELMEVSVVSVPADSGAEITSSAVARSMSIIQRALSREETMPKEKTIEERQEALEKSVGEINNMVADLVKLETKRQEDDEKIHKELEAEAEAARKATEEENTQRAEGRPAKEGRCVDAQYPVNMAGKCFSTKAAGEAFLKKDADIEAMEKSTKEAADQLKQLQELQKKRTEAGARGSPAPTEEEKVTDQDKQLAELSRKNAELVKEMEDIKAKLELPVSRGRGPSEEEEEEAKSKNPFETKAYTELDLHDKLDVIARRISDAGGIHAALEIKPRLETANSK